MRSLIFAHPFWVALGVFTALYILWAMFVMILVASLKEIKATDWHYRLYEKFFTPPYKQEYKSCTYASGLILTPLFIVLFCAFVLALSLRAYVIRFLFTGNVVIVNPNVVLDIIIVKRREFNSEEQIELVPFRPIVGLLLAWAVIFWLMMGYTVWYPESKSEVWVKGFAKGFFFGCPALIAFVWGCVTFHWLPRAREVIIEAWQTANDRFCRKIPIKQDLV